MFPILLKVGGFSVHSYGLFVAGGYLLALAYLLRQRPRMGLSEAELWRIFYALFGGALVGGKLVYLLAHSGEASLGERLANLRYGFVFYGGVLGSVLAGWIYVRWRGFGFLDQADFWIPALPLGHAVGRLGCFAAGCCYGAPTSGPWGMSFTNPACLVPDRWLGVSLHPVQLYEALGNLAIFGALHLHFLKRRLNGTAAPGAVFLAYLLLYALLRFGLEFLRGDDRGVQLGQLSLSQAASLAVLAAAFLASRRLKGALRNN